MYRKISIKINIYNKKRVGRGLYTQCGTWKVVRVYDLKKERERIKEATFDTRERKNIIKHEDGKNKIKKLNQNMHCRSRRILVLLVYLVFVLL